MSGLKIREELCIGCGSCIASCGNDGLREPEPVEKTSDGQAQNGSVPVVTEKSSSGSGSSVPVVTEKSSSGSGSSVPVVTENCILCGICVDACPEGAIYIDRETADNGTAEKNPSEWKDIWVVAQQQNGELLLVSLELVGKGRELADQKQCRLAVLLAGTLADSPENCLEAEGDEEPAVDAAGVAGEVCNSGISGNYEINIRNIDDESGDYKGDSTGNFSICGNTDLLVAAGADLVICCPDPVLEENPSDLMAEWICDEVREKHPEIILFGATSLGRELAPGVAARLQTGLTADCTALSIDPETGLLRQTRPAFGGNLMATIVCPDHRPQMATVRAGVFPAPEPDASRRGEVVICHRKGREESWIQVLKKAASENTDSIAKAEIIVDVGRGIGSRKNLPLMKQFAELIGGKLGCSRPLVEMGWCDYSHQVGQTGAVVTPKLLVCVGISGAIQHLAGIGGAENIIAINNDPAAPIFGVSHYALVGDCVEIVKEVVELLKKRSL